MDTIQNGQFIIIQRNSYMRVQKFNLSKPTINLGKESGNRLRTIDLSGIEGEPYESIFKMVPDEKKQQGWRLEVTNDAKDVEEFNKGISNCKYEIHFC